MIVVKCILKPLRVADLEKSLFIKNQKWLMRIICIWIKKTRSVIRKFIEKIEKGKWYGSTPPFCKLVNVNIGKYFLKLVDKHCNQNNILDKIFNRKTLKIRYFCTKNFFKIIHNHNNDIIRKYHDRTNNNDNNNNNNNRESKNNNFNNTSRENECNF